MPEAVITEVATPMLATTDGSMTLISTPNGKNHFWRFFEIGRRREHGFWSRTAPTSESPHVPKRFLDVQRELISERAFAVEYEAKFLDRDGQVFRTAAIEQCLVPEAPVGSGEPVTIGVDWARTHDWTTVAVLFGTRSRAGLSEIRRVPRGSWASMAGAVKEIVERYPGARVRCDSTGAGDPMLAQLREALPGRSVTGFGFTSQSKLQLIENLQSLFERGAIHMAPDPVLIRELEHFEAETSPSGAVRFGGTAGYHDDLVIALALAAWQLPHDYRAPLTLGGPRRFDPTNL